MTTRMHCDNPACDGWERAPGGSLMTLTIEGRDHHYCSLHCLRAWLTSVTATT